MYRMEVPMTTMSTAPAKFTRYRSVRKAAAKTEENEPPLPPAPVQSSQISRTPSRYHRSRPNHNQIPLPTTTSTSPPTCENPLPARIPSHSKQTFQSTSIQRGLTELVSPVNRTKSQNVHVHANQRGHTEPGKRLRSKTTTASDGPHPSSTRRSYEAAREEARMILEGEYDRLEKLKQQQKRVERRKWPDAPRAIAPSRSVKKTNLVAREVSPARTPQPDVVSSRNPQIAKTWTMYGPCAAPTTVSSPERPVKNCVIDRPIADHTALATSVIEHNALPSQLESQPRFDAPVSAVNAGERHVEIRCKSASISLPVLPTTTSQDILNSASVCMSEAIDPQHNVLLEVFSSFGLERSLRSYERIREVMNSWDSDTQNHLLISSKADCASAPFEQKESYARAPEGIMLQMYHSQQPQKWGKRWVILRADGQVTISKHENDGTAPNICHLSDFDIHVPTRKQARKLRSPKKYCFAIKSQQKSAMFLEGTNFIHYFATNDQKVAERWYQAIQTWRSWYLVNVLGEAKEKPNAGVNTMEAVGAIRPNTADSRVTVPYQLGSFKPLLDFSSDGFQLDHTTEQGRQSHEGTHRIAAQKALVESAVNRGSPERKGPNLVRASQPDLQQSSSPRRNILTGTNDLAGTATDDSDQAFTGKGLLARSASKRTQAATHGVAGKPLINLTPTSEFTDGSLLHRIEAVAISQGALEHKIDRQKRLEATTRVGEAAR